MLGVVFSGLLMALALPTAFGHYQILNLGLLAWIALVPLYQSLQSQAVVGRFPLPPCSVGGAANPGVHTGDQVSLKQAFFRGLLWGSVYYGVSLYWAFIAMHVYGNVPVWESVLGVAAVVLMMALSSALVSWGAVFASRKTFLPLWIWLPLSWVGGEFLRAYFPFGGFLWASVAYTQHASLHLLQILDMTGIYGIIFLIIFSNGVGSEIVFSLRKRRSWPVFPIVILMSLMTFVFYYGHQRFQHIQKNSESLQKMRVAVIQGNIPQEEKWQEEKIEEIIQRHMRLSAQVESQHPQLIVWPEAAYPMAIAPGTQRIRLLEGLKTPLLMGVVTYEGTIPQNWPPQPDEKNFALHNSAALIEPGGFIDGLYHKTHLVPMGEYVPLEKWFFFMQQIVPSISSFSPGKTLNLLGKPPLQWGVTICYEDLFPDISRQFVLQGADFLVNVTNDAWYEHSSAIFQHMDFSRYRAIENRRALVRATNTGVTALLSPTGEILAQAPTFQEASLVGDIPLGGTLSFYTRHGDIFAWACIASMGLLIIRSRIKRRNAHGE